MSGPFHSNGIADPGQLTFLQQMFDRFCKEHHISPGTHDAEKIAQAAMSLFQAGVYDEAELRESLEEFRRRWAG